MKSFLIKVPQNNQKTAKSFYQLLHALYETLSEAQISFEIFVHQQHINFCFTCKEDRSALVSGQIYAIFPEAEIVEIEDPAKSFKNNFVGGEVFLKRKDLFSIKTFENFEGDSLAGVLSVFSKAKIDENILFQIVMRPKKDTAMLHFKRNWSRRFENIRHVFRFKYYFKKGDFKKQFNDAFLKKSEENLFDVNIRFLVNSSQKDTIFNAIKNSIYQFNTIDLNGFEVGKKTTELFFKQVETRKLSRPFSLSQIELSTIFHLPNEKEVPNIVYVLSKKSEPPSSLPINQKNSNISFFGTTNFHNSFVPFGILSEDRRRHMYCVGKSGSGKSKLLELLIANDLKNGRGIGVLDPHGDLVDNVLRMVPKERIKDVVIFDPADEQFPIAFNPLEKVPSALKIRVTIGILEIFKKLFGTNWSERLEHVLRYTILALLDSPNTTVLSILKMLSDKNYRQYIVKNIKDDVVKNFWVNEFASWSEKFDSEAITPLLNKVGQFVATNMVRNIVGQPKNKVDFRKIMDEGKILLMKVSKGMLGEENASLLGAMAITKIYQAAMSRANIKEEDRRDFYFYVDEFHNFATNTFDEILSEARKYRLNLSLAHQYMGQLSPKIRTTIFGNVGSLVSFRVGSEDAGILAQEYAPIFSTHDLINLGIREFYCKISANGEVSQAFSGRTLDLNFPKEDFTKDCIEFSRKNYCQPIEKVRKAISAWEEGKTEEAKDSSLEGVSFEEPIV